MKNKPQITGYHVYAGTPTKESVRTWQILLQLASLQNYKNEWGPIKLFANRETIDFYKQIGLLQYYDGVEEFDLGLLAGIDRRVYFAAGKILAQLQVPEEECIFLDTDLIIGRKHTQEWEMNETVSVFHRETLDAYPDLWDRWNYDGMVNDAFPINAAFTLWRNKDLRRDYAGRAMRFMRNNTFYGIHNPNVLMITAEQRILAMFLKEKGIEPNYFIKEIWFSTEKIEDVRWIYDVLGKNYQEIKDDMYHLWGFKQTLANDPMAAAEFSITLIELLQKTPEIDVDQILGSLSSL